MHYQLLLRVMRNHGMGILLDSPAHGFRVRRILLETVLATDMSVHDVFMNRLRGITKGENITICRRQITVCQAILKCADISNPVSFPWRLLHCAHVIPHSESAIRGIETLGKCINA